MSRRRGSHAVEFAVLMPILLLVVSGVVDVGQLLVLSQSAVEAVADGAQAGALADEDEGEDPKATAIAAAKSAFAASSASGTLVVGAVTQTVAGDVILTVTGSVTFEPIFGMFDLPTTVTYSNAMRLAFPPD